MSITITAVVTKKSSRKSRGRKEPEPEVEEAAEAAPEEPSAAEICENFGLNDVELDHTADDYQTITSYELFQQTYKKKIQEGNPKVPKPKLAMLVAAKWREFQVWTPTPLSSPYLLSKRGSCWKERKKPVSCPLLRGH